MDHHTHHDKQSELPFEVRLEKLLEHWIKHNDDHVSSYEDWAKKAGTEKFTETASLIQEAAQLTGQVTEKFREALKSIKK